MSSARTDSLAPEWLRLVGMVACFGAALLACEPIESRGDIFAPAPREAPPVPDLADPVGTGSAAAGTPTAAAPGVAPVDPAFAFPTEPPLVLSSEELAQGDLASGMATAAGVDASKLEGEPPALEAPAAPSAPPPIGLPSPVQWPVRLVSTLPQAQPPRAILGLPSGEERVVSPGSILAEQGLVVMAVSGNKVTLARIEPMGDHARIDTVELTAQY